MKPEVSVVIPTQNRPELLLRAIRSALEQTYTELEVIVVVDGGKGISEAIIRDKVRDDRVHIVPLPSKVGAAEARNIGVRVARGCWIAFLDDDDFWLPTKIARQIAAARQSSGRFPLVSCQVIARSKSQSWLWPRKSPTAPLCEYLLARSSLTFGEGLLATPTLFVHKDLFLHFEFDRKLPRFEDLDWILRCTSNSQVKVEFVNEPLVVVTVGNDRESLSNSGDWRTSLQWLGKIATLVTPRARAGFLAGTVALQARRQRDWRGTISILARIIRSGASKPIDYILVVQRWMPFPFDRVAIQRAISRLPSRESISDLKMESTAERD